MYLSKSSDEQKVEPEVHAEDAALEFDVFGVVPPLRIEAHAKIVLRHHGQHRLIGHKAEKEKRAGAAVIGAADVHRLDGIGAVRSARGLVRLAVAGAARQKIAAELPIDIDMLVVRDPEGDADLAAPRHRDELLVGGDGAFEPPGKIGHIEALPIESDGIVVAADVHRDLNGAPVHGIGDAPGRFFLPAGSKKERAAERCNECKKTRQNLFHKNPPPIFHFILLQKQRKQLFRYR